MGLDTKIYWLTDRQSQCDFDLGLGRIGTRIWERQGNLRENYSSGVFKRIVEEESEVSL
jgi:hypothetical protein